MSDTYPAEDTYTYNQVPGFSELQNAYFSPYSSVAELFQVLEAVSEYAINEYIEDTVKITIHYGNSGSTNGKDITIPQGSGGFTPTATDGTFRQYEGSVTLIHELKAKGSGDNHNHAIIASYII